MKKLLGIFTLVMSAICYAEEKQGMMVDVPQSKIVTYIVAAVVIVILLYVAVRKFKKFSDVMKKIQQNLISKEKDFIEKVDFLLEFDKKKVSAFGARSSGKTNYWATFTHKQRYDLNNEKYLNVVFDTKGIQNETRLYLNSLYEILAKGGMIPRTEDKDKRVIQLDLTLKNEKYDKPIQQMFESYDYPGEALKYIDEYTKYLNGQVREDELSPNQKNHFNTLKELIENIHNCTGCILIVDPNPDPDEERAQDMLTSIVFSEIKRIEAEKKIKVPVVMLISKADTLKIFEGKLGQNFESDRKKAAKFLKEYHAKYYDHFSDNDLNIFPVSSLGNDAILKEIKDEKGNKIIGKDGKAVMGYFPVLNNSKGLESIYLEKPVEYILEKRNLLWKERVVDIFNDPRLPYKVAKKIFTKFKEKVDMKEEVFPVVTNLFHDVRRKFIKRRFTFTSVVLAVIIMGYLMSGFFLYAKFQKFLAESELYKGKKNYFSEKLEFYKKNTPNMWYIKYYRLFINYDIEKATKDLYDSIFDSPEIDDMTKMMYLEDYLNIYSKKSASVEYKKKLTMLEDLYFKELSSDYLSASDKIEKYRQKDFILRDDIFNKKLGYVVEEIELLKKLHDSNRSILLFREYLKLKLRTYEYIFVEELKKFYEEKRLEVDGNNINPDKLRSLRNDFKEFQKSYLIKEVGELDAIINVRESEDKYKSLRYEYGKLGLQSETYQLENFITKCDDYKTKYPDSKYIVEINNMRTKMSDSNEESAFRKILTLEDAKKFLSKFPKTSRAFVVFNKFPDTKENVEIKAYYLSVLNNSKDVDGIVEEIKKYNDSQLMIRIIKESNILNSENIDDLNQKIAEFDSLGYKNNFITETKEILKRTVRLLEIKKLAKIEDKINQLIEYGNETYKFNDSDFEAANQSNKNKSKFILLDTVKTRLGTIEVNENLNDEDLANIKEFYTLKAYNPTFFAGNEDVKNKETEIEDKITKLVARYKDAKAIYLQTKNEGADKLISYSFEYEKIFAKVQRVASYQEIPQKLRSAALAEIDGDISASIKTSISTMKDETFKSIITTIDKYNSALSMDTLYDVKKKIQDYEDIFGKNDKTIIYFTQLNEIENGAEVEVFLDMKNKEALNKMGIDDFTEKKVKIDNTEYNFVNASAKVKCAIRPNSKIQAILKYNTTNFLGLFGAEKISNSKVFDISENEYELSVLKDNKTYDIVGRIVIEKSKLRINK